MYQLSHNKNFAQLNRILLRFRNTINENQLIIVIIIVFAITILPNLILAIIAPGRSIIEKRFATDDAYYYFQIARNIINGYGSSFDTITRTNGFQPLWMLLIIPIFSFSRIDPILPLRIVLLISSFLHFGSIILLILSFRKSSKNLLIVFIPILLLILSPSWNAEIDSGLETALNIFLTSLFVYKMVALIGGTSKCNMKNMFIIGCVAGLLVLARLDTIFLILIASLYLCWFILTRYPKQWTTIGSLGIYYSAPIVLIIVSYLVFNKIYYGGIFPVSGQVKMYWATVGGSVFGSLSNDPLERIRLFFGTGATRTIVGPVNASLSFLMLNRLSPTKTAIILGVCSILFIFAISLKKSVLKPVLVTLLIASIIHTLFYALVGYVQTRAWYWVAELTTVVCFIVLGMTSLVEIIKNQLVYFIITVTCYGLITILVIPPYESYIFESYAFRSMDGENYLSRAQFLEDSTSPNSVIGTPNAGGLGYFTNRTIVNIDGLVNNYEFFDSMKTSKSALYLKRIGVDFIFIGPGYEKYEPYSSMLSEKLELVQRWTNVEGKRPHDLYKYWP